MVRPRARGGAFVRQPSAGPSAGVRAQYDPAVRTAFLILIASIAASALAAGDASAGDARASDAGAYAFTLSDKTVERCVQLGEGESVRYRFRASAPVDFNVHYHRDADVIYPVRRNGVRAANGTFRAPLGEQYCLMWQRRGGDPVAVEVRIDRVAGP
jgi:hypothetical protein